MTDDDRAANLTTADALLHVAVLMETAGSADQTRYIVGLPVADLRIVVEHLSGALTANYLHLGIGPRPFAASAREQAMHIIASGGDCAGGVFCACQTRPR